VLDSITDGDAECEEEDLSDREERSAKDDVANRPPVVEGTEDKDEL